MSIKVGINGYGRIGSSVLRIISQRPDIQLCGINLRKAELDHMAYMTKYDSVFGRFDGTVEVAENGLMINGNFVRVFSESDPALIPWKDCGAEYIIESTGAYNTVELAGQHLNGGAKKVILSAPTKDNIMPTFVMGVNHWEYKPEYKVISNASCTTNCLAPLIKIINDKFGVEKGLMSTIHASTSKQKPVDARAGRDWRTGRSVFNNIIPSSTGAAKAVGLVIPELKGKLTGMSFRVPSNDVSVVDLTVQLKVNTTYEEICSAVKEASETSMKGIVAYTADEVVSSDFRGESHTCIFDEKAGIMLDGGFVKLIAWYDNEYGYASKVVDLLEYIYAADNNA